MSWDMALARTSSGTMTSDAAAPGPDLQPVELRSISRSADEKATEVRPAALLPRNERRDRLFFLDMRDLLDDTDGIRGPRVAGEDEYHSEGERVKPV
jgi:hypothetical protein